MSGHGHVTPNADGSKARCGGPKLCAVCALEMLEETLLALQALHEGDPEGKVVPFTGITKLPLPVKVVLAAGMELTEVVVLGWAPDGSFHYGASEPDMSRALMLFACAQRLITDQMDLS